MELLQPLDERGLAAALAHLHAHDRDLARILDTYGPPPLWARPPGFATLVHIILEQQVSLASARAAFDRLSAAVDPLLPAGFLTLDDGALKAIGFSRQKTLYARCLAQAVLDGTLDLEALATVDDEAVIEALTRVKGIGRWTADIYLLMALRRPDAWPAGDLGLVAAVQKAKVFPARLDAVAMEAIARPWQPWRAVAARVLWHYYLSTPPAERRTWARP